MGIRYICDLCGKEFDVKGDIGASGYPVSYGMPLEKWATITYMAPKAREEPEPGRTGLVAMYPENMPIGYLVCSQVCAEKALTEIGARLQAAFDEVTG